MSRLLDWFSRLWERLVADYQQKLEVKESSHYFHHAIDSLLIVLGAWLLIRILRYFVLRFERRVDRIHGAGYRRRIETITSLTRSIFRYAVYVGCTFWIMSEWGVNTDSLLVGTAVIGAAIGFGAQGIVQDVITGLSMLAEDQLSVGDFVEIAGKTGAVEEVGLRVIKIRDALGAQHVIFNRMINMVSNFTAGAVQAWVDVSLESAADEKKAVAVAEKICLDMAAELPHFPRPPMVEGVRSSSTGEIFLRIDAVVLPKQEVVLRTHFPERIRSAFAAQGIIIARDRIRVIISSELFKQAMNRGKQSGVFEAPFIRDSIL
jgi:small-conductance mechanosensitive channel